MAELRTQRHWAGVALVLAAALALGACSRGPKRTTQLVPINAHPAKGAPLEQSQRLLAQDAVAAGSLYYVSHEHGRLPSGQLQVTVNLEGRTGMSDRWLEWQMVFYDRGRTPVEETAWNPLHVRPDVVHAIKANSIRPDVEDYTLFLREPR